MGNLGVDGNGNVYVAGIFNAKTLAIGSTTLTNTDTSGNLPDVFIAKFTSSGTAVWATSFGGRLSEVSDINNPLGFAVTGKGDVYISGIYHSPSITIGSTVLSSSTTMGNTFLARFDTGGNAVWAHNYDAYVNICNIVADKNENFYMTGYIDSTVTEVFGRDTITTNVQSSVLYARLDRLGSVLWAKASGQAYAASGFSIALDLCGNLWMSGCMGGNSPYADTITFDGNRIIVPPVSNFPIFIMEMDTLGGYKNGLALPGGGASDAKISSDIVTDNKGNFYIAGAFTGVTMHIGPDVLGYSVGLGSVFFGKYKYDTILCPEETEVKELQSPPNNYVIFPNPAANDFTISSGEPVLSNCKCCHL